MWNSEIYLKAHCSIQEEIKPKIYFLHKKWCIKATKCKMQSHTKNPDIQRENPTVICLHVLQAFFYMLTQNSNYRSCKLTSVFQNYELYVKHAFSLKQLPLIKTVKANTTQVQPTAVPSNISNCLLSNTLNKLQQTVHYK